MRMLPKILALQALVLVLSAANGGGDGEKGHEDMVSPYLQSYAVPFAGPVPPLKPHRLNDEFTRDKPLSSVPPFASLDPKWLLWDPGESFSFSGIDVALQMMLMNGGGDDKSWFGRVQPMPLPTPGGAALEYRLYGRCTLANIEGVNSNYTDQLMGLILGEDLIGDPEGSPLWALSQRYARVGEVAEGNIEASEFASWDALDAPLGTVNCGWPMQFMRARVETQATLPGPTYTTTIYFDASVDGVGWQRVAVFADLPNAIRHAGFGQRCTGNAFFSGYYDYFRYFEMPTFADTNPSGSRQELGAV